MNITESQMQVLVQQDSHTLADWWCDLNRWNWPENLPDPESREAFMNRSGRSSVRWAIQCWIREQVGERLISRQWNIDMPDDVFDDFWRKKEGDPSAGALYSQWTDEWVKQQGW